jgi:hypothetical protein
LKNPAEFSANSADNSVNSAEFRISKNFMFLLHINYISAEFFQFSTKFSEFSKMRRNRWEAIFHCPLNSVTLPKNDFKQQSQMQKMVVTDYCALRIYSPTSEASGEGILQSMKQSVEKWLPILERQMGSCRIRLPTIDCLPAYAECTPLLKIAIVDEVRQLLCK